MHIHHDPEHTENWGDTWSSGERREYIDAEHANHRAGELMVRVRGVLSENERHLVIELEEAEAEAQESTIGFYKEKLRRLVPDRRDLVTWAFTRPSVRPEDF